jgi:hypothetical protein
MTRKALLIGAQTNGLAGALNDVAAMVRALEPRGFQIEQLTGPAASRGGILDAYEKLIADAHPDDAFLVYYSGHGGLLKPPAGEVAGADGARPPATRPDLQFIVPDDYGDSGDDDFRGITGVELSVLLARLTTITPNATVVLDCCHAAHMSRHAGLRVKSLLRQAPAHHHMTYENVRRHLTRLVSDGLEVRRRDPSSNPHAVRVVACSPLQSAWEGTNRDGVEMGLLTDALSRALVETDGMRVSWSTLMDAVRREVQVFAPTQRPEAEGPSGRQPFETDDVDPLATLPVVVTDGDRIRLLGAPLLDVRLGDEFAIMPGGAAGPGDGPAVGTATVDGLAPMAALARLRLAQGLRRVPEDARAHRTRAAAPALPVRLPDRHPMAAELRTAMALRPLVRAAEPGEETVIEVVAAAPDGLVVRDSTGPLHAPYPATAVGIGQIVVNLQRIAQATALRRLEADPAAPLDHRVVVEWGRVRDAEEEPFPASGALVHAHPDERIFFRLRNDGDDTVYVSLIDIGISSRISVLTAADPEGVRLAAGESYPFGWNEDAGRLTGVEVTWPESVDKTFARPETVMVIISDGCVDVSVLQQQGVRGAGHHHDPVANGSALERLLTQVATGATREVGAPPGRKVRYAVHPIDFMVSPAAPPEPERPTFLVDDRPDQPVRLLASRGALPGRVAVRIAELVVHRNRALGGADIRVDAVVLTAGAGDQPVYRSETMRFSNVRDDERLPLDEVLIYHGPAVDFLDIAVWVSRDTTGSLALSELLEQGLTSPAVQVAGAQAAALVLTAPHAVAAAAVMGAGAAVVNTAYRLLTGVVGSSVGLYRTSLLAQEQFGIGRHERHPQGFSFTFSVEPVS